MMVSFYKLFVIFQEGINTVLKEWPNADKNVYAFNTGSFSGMAFIFAIYLGSAGYTVSIVGVSATRFSSNKILAVINWLKSRLASHFK